MTKPKPNKLEDGLVIGEPVIDLVMAAYRADLPVMLEGTHGLGKSEVLHEAAKRLGIGCVVIDLSICEPTDLVGLPQFRDGRTDFAPPAQLPIDGKGLLVLEELNRSPRYVRAPCLQLLTARRLNSYVLPESWLPVACINPPSHGDDDERYDVEELDPALRSRFVCVRVRAGLQEWLTWARANDVHPAVLDAVEQGGPDALSGPAVNPRAWFYASRFLDAWESSPRTDAVFAAALVGILGDVWGIALARIYATNERPLDPQEVLDAWATNRSVIETWVHRGRLDMLQATWTALQKHLSSNAIARDVALRPPVRRNCEEFVGLLPPDLRRSAGSWLASQFASFAGDAALRAPRRARRGNV